MEKKKIYTSPAIRIVAVRNSRILCGSPFNLYEDPVDVDDYTIIEDEFYF